MQSIPYHFSKKIFVTSNVREVLPCSQLLKSTSDQDPLCRQNLVALRTMFVPGKHGNSAVFPGLVTGHRKLTTLTACAVCVMSIQIKSQTPHAC